MGDSRLPTPPRFGYREYRAPTGSLSKRACSDARGPISLCRGIEAD